MYSEKIMTENQIELAYERAIDDLDRDYVSGIIDDIDYNLCLAELKSWVEYEYSLLSQSVAA